MEGDPRAHEGFGTLTRTGQSLAEAGYSPSIYCVRQSLRANGTRPGMFSLCSVKILGSNHPVDPGGLPRPTCEPQNSPAPLV